MTYVFKTRSEINGVKNFDNFIDAYREIKKDASVWQISFKDNEIWKIKTKNDRWSAKVEEKLCELSKDYKNARSSDVFWVNKLIQVADFVQIWRDFTLSPVEREEILTLSSVIGIMSDDNFKSYHSDIEYNPSGIMD